MVKVNICDSPNRNILREPSKLRFIYCLVVSGCYLGMSGWFAAMVRRDESHWIHNNAFPRSLSHSLLGDHSHITLQ